MNVFDLEGNINSDVSDALHELGNMGVGTVSVALGKMLGSRVTIGTPVVLPADVSGDTYAHVQEDQMIFGTIIRQDAEQGGVMLFIMQKKFMVDIVNKITGGQMATPIAVLDEGYIGAMQELINIMAAAYLKSVGGYTGLRLFSSQVAMGDEVFEKFTPFSREQQARLTKRAVCICVDMMLIDQNSNKICDIGKAIMIPYENVIKSFITGMKL